MKREIPINNEDFFFQKRQRKKQKKKQKKKTKKKLKNLHAHQNTTQHRTRTCALCKLASKLSLL